jgi:hypothetical protein
MARSTACRRADLSDDFDAATVSSRFHPLADDSIRFAAVIARCPGRVDVRGVDGVAARREELVGTAKEAALSAVQPNTLPPRTIGAVKRSVRPKLRRCICGVLFGRYRIADERQGRKARRALATGEGNLEPLHGTTHAA